MEEFSLAEIGSRPWVGRSNGLGMGVETFYRVAEGLAAKGLVGRFTTVLEHARAVGAAPRVARCTALMAWAVPPGRELEAGAEIGRHKILTHAYWRDSGPQLGDLNLFGVAHAPDEEAAEQHKRAIDAHVEEAGIPILRSGIYWSVRSAVRPSQILPSAYEIWCRQHDVDVDEMRLAPSPS
jgi:hypothetical protein